MDRLRLCMDSQPTVRLPSHSPSASYLTVLNADVLEFTVVTANGTILRCSPYQNPTLFTALRGGGSSFCVVLETAFKAHVPPAGFVGVFGSFGLKEGTDASKEEGKQAWREMVKRWTELQPKLSKAGPFAGYTYVVRVPNTLQLSRSAADSSSSAAETGAYALRLHPPFRQHPAREGPLHANPRSFRRGSEHRH